MEVIFSDRLRWLKAGAAAALFAGLCLHADGEIARREPPLESLHTQGAALRGRIVNGASKKVLAATPDWVEVWTPGGPVRVLGQTSPAALPGDHVTFIGEVSGSGEVRSSRMRVNAGHAWKRPLNYAVSAATLLAWAGLFLWGRRRRA